MKLWGKRKLDRETYSNTSNTNRYYESLTPKNDIENGQEYIAALDWQFRGKTFIILRFPVLMVLVRAV